MKYKKKYILFLILTLTVLVFSCQSNHNNNIEYALQNVINRFPQLPKNEGNLTDFYKLTRAVVIGEKNIEIQLRSSPDTVNDYQQIIVIRNPQNEYYAIPFFSNTYRDFWNFEFDNLETDFKINTTFESIFNDAMDTLNLHDTLGTFGNVQSIVVEMLLSLLQCRTVYLSDSSAITQVSWSSKDNYSIYLSEEDMNSCAVRFRKNYEDIKNVIQPTNTIFFNYNTAWDTENNRIYQISNNRDMRHKQKYILKLKTYRQDCVDR